MLEGRFALEDGTHAAGGARRRRHRRARPTGDPYRRHAPGSPARRHRAGHARAGHTRGAAPRRLAARALRDGRRRRRGSTRRGCAHRSNRAGDRSCPGSRSTSPTRCCSLASRSPRGDDELAELALSNSRRRAELNPGIASIAAAAAHVRGLLERSQADLRRRSISSSARRGRSSWRPRSRTSAQN